MTCFLTHVPLSSLSVLSCLLVLLTVTLVNMLSAKRPRHQTVNLTTAPASIRQNLRQIR